MAWPLHPPGERPWYPLNKGLGVPQNQSGCLEKKNLLFLPGNEPWLLRHAAHRLVTTTKLSLHPLKIMLTQYFHDTNYCTIINFMKKNTVGVKCHHLPHMFIEEQLWEWRHKINAIISGSYGPAWTLHFAQEWKWSTLDFTTLSIFYHAYFWDGIWDVHHLQMLFHIQDTRRSDYQNAKYSGFSNDPFLQKSYHTHHTRMVYAQSGI